jgi:MarR family 2-MHQ and catechol resistance regulon transcriptional repressor
MPTIVEKAQLLIDYLETVIDRAGRWQNDMKRDRMGHLSRHEMEAFVQLGRKGKLTMGELADNLLLSVSSATFLADKLEEKGLVVRSRSLDDRRVVRVGLTGEGAKSYDEFHQMILNFATTVLQSLEEHEQDLLLALYRKIGDGFPVVERKKD